MLNPFALKNNALKKPFILTGRHRGAAKDIGQRRSFDQIISICRGNCTSLQD